MEKKTITPEYIVEAFKQTGLKARQGAYFSMGDCACGLGAYFQYKKLGKDIDEFGEGSINDILEDDLQELGSGFRIGFVQGFDGESKRSYNTGIEGYNEGYEIGKASWEAVRASGIEVVEDKYLDDTDGDYEEYDHDDYYHDDEEL